jgi:hypothetical protein
MSVLLGRWLIKTDGQLCVIWALVAILLVQVSIKIANLESKRYRKRDAARKQKLLEKFPTPQPKSREQEEIDRKYREFYDRATPTEKKLQHLRIALVGVMILLTIIQKGPKIIYIIRELLKLNG